MQSNLLDEIKIDNNLKEGIIDFVNTKYVSFYDLTNNTDPYVVKVVMLWRVFYQNMRFSIFKSIYFPTLNVPSPVMINKKSITNGCPLSTEKQHRQVEKFTLPSDTVIMDLV